MAALKTLDWNQMSQLGLLERINKELLHPLGLAASRETETGHSEKVLIVNGDDPDRTWEYDPELELKPILSKDEIWQKLNEWGLVTDGKEE